MINALNTQNGHDIRRNHVPYAGPSVEIFAKIIMTGAVPDYLLKTKDYQMWKASQMKGFMIATFVWVKYMTRDQIHSCHKN